MGEDIAYQVRDEVVSLEEIGYGAITVLHSHTVTELVQYFTLIMLLFTVFHFHNVTELLQYFTLMIF